MPDIPSTADIPLIVRGGKLPLNFEPTPQEYYEALVPRLRISISDEQVVLGSSDETEPTDNVGPWAIDYSWRFWDASQNRYVGTVSIFDALYTLRFIGEPTENRHQIFQDKSGTLALLIDTYVPRATEILDTGAQIDIDCSLSDSFLARLSEDATIMVNNIPEGGKVTIALVNNGTAFTATFSPNVKFVSVPTQPVADAGQAAVGIYEIRGANEDATAFTFSADGNTTATSDQFSSTGSLLLPAHEGRYINLGTTDAVPADTYILSVDSPSLATLSQDANLTTANASWTISSRVFGSLVGSYNVSNETGIDVSPGGTGEVDPGYGGGSGGSGNVP